MEEEVDKLIIDAEALLTTMMNFVYITIIIATATNITTIMITIVKILIVIMIKVTPGGR